MRVIALDAKPPKQSPADRQCATCGVKLSVYNHDEHCAVHAPEPDWTYLGMKFDFCPKCGCLVQMKRNRKTKLCDDCRWGR